MSEQLSVVIHLFIQHGISVRALGKVGKLSEQFVLLQMNAIK